MAHEASGAGALVLDVEGLAVEFAGPGDYVRVVDGLGFSLEVGGSLTIVGESGCGKSLTAGRHARGGRARPHRRMTYRNSSAESLLEGWVEARKRGVHMGRRPKLSDHQQHEILQRLANGETCRAIAKSYRVHHSTVSRLAS